MGGQCGEGLPATTEQARSPPDVPLCLAPRRGVQRPGLSSRQGDGLARGAHCSPLHRLSLAKDPGAEGMPFPGRKPQPSQGANPCRSLSVVRCRGHLQEPESDSLHGERGRVSGQVTGHSSRGKSWPRRPCPGQAPWPHSAKVSARLQRPPDLAVERKALRPTSAGPAPRRASPGSGHTPGGIRAPVEAPDHNPPVSAIDAIL